ncbi:hypothetical protein ZWY2020_054918 [Hordeum vulgare]|nr:hypothetical protein ZWY2020_054918 [Hordeum vulgare]
METGGGRAPQGEQEVLRWQPIGTAQGSEDRTGAPPAPLFEPASSSRGPASPPRQHRQVHFSSLYVTILTVTGLPAARLQVRHRRHPGHRLVLRRHDLRPRLLHRRHLRRAHQPGGDLPGCSWREAAADRGGVHHIIMRCLGAICSASVILAHCHRVRRVPVSPPGTIPITGTGINPARLFGAAIIYEQSTP